MVLHEFPDLRWLKQQVEQRFTSQQGWRGTPLRHPGWPTVVLNVATQQAYRDQVVGPVSLFMNRKGQSLVEANKRTTRVGEDYFFMTNQQQEYTLTVDAPQPVETFNIHFGEHFFTQLYHSLVTPSAYLLENPAASSKPPIGFFNRLHPKDSVVKLAMRRLQDTVPSDSLLTEEILYELALHLLHLHQHDLSRMHKLPPVKATTREEIFRRLSGTVDYMYTFYHQTLSLDELAGVALLSKFHFLRLFRAAFWQTPHQFMTRIRLEKAQLLLQYSDQSLQGIADQVGLGNASSLSRLFRQRIGVYPTVYRAEMRK